MLAQLLLARDNTRNSLFSKRIQQPCNGVNAHLWGNGPAFVHQDDCAWFHLRHDASDDRFWIAAAGIKAANTPAYAPHAPLRQSFGQENAFDSDRCPKSRRFRADPVKHRLRKIQFPANSTWESAPERRGRMRMRVMRDFVTAPPNFGRNVSQRLRAFAHEKKRCPGTMLVQQIQNLGRVLGVGTIVDRQPNLRLLGFEASENPARTLSGRHKEMVENIEIWRDEYDQRQPRCRIRSQPHERDNLPGQFTKQKTAWH
jgi:hypothetical protein